MSIHSIESFDPLLRDLASYGLVVREEQDGADSWKLTDRAQARLSELLDRRGGPLVPEKLIYFDRLCSQCHVRGLTRLREGRYLCDSCAPRHEPGDRSVEAPAASAG